MAGCVCLCSSCCISAGFCGLVVWSGLDLAMADPLPSTRPCPSSSATKVSSDWISELLAWEPNFSLMPELRWRNAIFWATGPGQKNSYGGLACARARSPPIFVTGWVGPSRQEDCAT
ncbi:uncharacterized protein BO88DRAFT_417071 [Aspergillus vadensis CBS 113365]|uniref:Secreted protein n=1 Tax=Aspergillus vadensis (strain CBS 113365 / IMI 142717 / IBT 24658) TaxID=1448311 RepID=A0A319BVP0_ASPVC|nr:hypothetical protein BO88DRAFT_417071 [Aspergillus vadensis CBS 113365]PYH67198.1 hypothetical protein BO88DRAFT_417071 [Aspergillus vadensis CBS 113365]